MILCDNKSAVEDKIIMALSKECSIDISWIPREINHVADKVCKLDTTLKTIKTFPNSFPIDEIFNIHRAVITKKCILYYKLINNDIYLVLFFDTKSDVSQLKKLL